ncbi:MAG: VWA-like domain-containing protein [Nitrososphaeria archaeon]
MNNVLFPELFNKKREINTKDCKTTTNKIQEKTEENQEVENEKQEVEKNKICEVNKTDNSNKPKSNMKLRSELEETLRSITTYFTVMHPFWGTIIANLEVIIDEESEIYAATDCHSKIVFGNKAFGLSKEAIKFIYLHEILHVSFHHSQRKKPTYDHHLWNVACDYAVNSILVDEMNYPIPKELDPCYNEKFKKMSAEEIYYKLIENQVENKFNPIFADLLPSSNPREEVDKVKSILVQADIVNSKFPKAKGNIPNSLMEHIKKIKEPKVPFERLLAKYVSQLTSGKEEFSYNPIHKRKFIEYEIISPTISKALEPKIYLVIDTSGSISSEELSIFAGAMKKLSTISSELTVITHDVSVQQVIRSSQVDKFLQKVEFKGRGGTSHIEAFKHIEELSKREGYPDVVICLTDGYTDFPEKPKYPVIWVLTKQHNPPPWGIKVVIEKED